PKGACGKWTPIIKPEGAKIETPADLLRLISGAAASQPRMTVPQSKADTLGEVHAAPQDARTLVDALEWHVHSHPERPHVYLCVDDKQEQEISYQALLRGAEAVAAGLQHAGLEPGETVAIMLPTSEEYLLTFFGILLAGGIPVPIYPPARLTQIEDHLRRHVRILSNAGVVKLVTVPEASRLARLLKSHIASLRRIFTVEELSSSAQTLARPTLKPDDIAFLQYTSGSTADPKGVVLTHANLLSNIRAMGNVLEVDSTDVFVSWMPMYHDMGLIGAWLGSLYYAMPLVLMSPLNFLARPARWLWAIHRHRATLSAGPNFAYELCLGKIDEQDIEGLDLSSWRLAVNGAEPISPDTLIAFAKRFARYGFREEVLCPVYGLAEGSLGLTFPPMGRGPVIDHVDRETFRREGRAIPADNTESQTLRFVGCGQTLPGHEIRIVDAAGIEVVDRQEGRLQFRGPSATSGYYRNPEASNRLFDGDWLESGDLAYVADGEVFITGRVKDVIIRAGRNIYPQELEEAIGHIPGIRRGCVAVFAATDAVGGTESLVVLAETRQTDASARAELEAHITSTAVDLVGTPPDDIVLAVPHTVLKTSSGKLCRAASRDLYQGGKLG
ncbi:MAG: fatty acyl-AMP ligase, partial [Acidiferrobacterales bacterium]